MIDTLRLRVLHTKRLTIGEIAREMDTSPAIVESELKKMGYTPLYRQTDPEPSSFTVKNKMKEENNNMPRGSKTPVEKISEINRLLKEGKSKMEIVTLTGLSKSTVSRVCKLIDTENEPATAATDTSSSTIIPVQHDEDNPVSIISDDQENVKPTGDNPENRLPDVVMEALLEKRDDLIRKIQEEESVIKVWRKDLTDINSYIRKVKEAAK